MSATSPLGLIAGNGRFPFLVADAARRAGRKVVAVAIKEEASPDLAAGVDEIHWIGLGQLGRCIEALRAAGVSEAVMAGQVKHRQIFSDIVPDLKLMTVLARLAVKNTDSLIGGVADALGREGITLLPSTSLLSDQMAQPGPNTRRRPSRDESRDIEYGQEIARALTALDLGQTVVVKDRAAVALEAMEGTDEVIRRAGRIAGVGCTVVKLGKPKQDMRFDVPVAGAGTLEAMREAGARVLAVEAMRTLLIDRAAFLAQADEAGIAVVGLERPRTWTGAERAIRVAVVGVGSLGQHHARVCAGLPGATWWGVFDTDRDRADAVAARHGCRAFGHLRDLLPEAEAIAVAVPTVDHHRLARVLLEAGKDVLVEKPICSTLAEAEDLIRLARERRLILQVGHIERFNPATDVLRANAVRPRFIEVHRLGAFSPRSLDVDVVLDLMIHDLDIVLSLDGSEAVQVDAVGVPVLTPRVDIANARLRFASGLIANLTASRVSAERIRKFRVFSPRTYISVDFAAREAQVYRLVEGPNGPEIQSERTAAPDEEPLRRQLAAFVTAVKDRSEPVVSGADGLRALALAHEILARMAADPK